MKLCSCCQWVKEEKPKHRSRALLVSTITTKKKKIPFVLCNYCDGPAVKQAKKNKLL